MEYKKLGNSGIDVSLISYGTFGLGGGNTWSDMSFKVKEVEDLLQYAADLGINYIDTAPVYGIGTSEELLGQALKNCRDKFVLQTKCSLNWRNEDGGVFEYERDGKTVKRDLSKQAIIKDVEESLDRLKTDYIDVLVVHRQSNITPISETADALNTLIEQGKIRAAGISNSTPDDLKEYKKYIDIAVCQEKYSIVNDANAISYAPVCKELNTVFQFYGYLEEGALTGKGFYDKTFIKEDLRSRTPLIVEPYRTAVFEMFDKFEPLCQKYNCSIPNLLQVYAINRVPNVNLLTGFRRKETIKNTCEALDIKVCDADLDAIGDAANIVKTALKQLNA